MTISSDEESLLGSLEAFFRLLAQTLPRGSLDQPWPLWRICPWSHAKRMAAKGVFLWTGETEHKYHKQGIIGASAKQESMMGGGVCRARQSRCPYYTRPRRARSTCRMHQLCFLIK